MFNFYYSLQCYYKRFFVKPYKVKFEDSYIIHSDKFAMDIVPNAQTAFIYFNNLYKLNKIKKLNIVIRRIQHTIYTVWKHDLLHGDLHLNNILINTKTNMPKIIDFGSAIKVKTKIPMNTLKTVHTNKLDKLNKKNEKWFRNEINLSMDYNPNMLNNTYFFCEETLYFNKTNYK